MKIWQTARILVGVCLVLSACGQENSPKPQDALDASYIMQDHDQIQPNVILSGIDRSVFDEEANLSPLTTPIPCRFEKSGPAYREQSKELSLSSYNLIQYNLAIPVANNKDPYYPYAYTGGDTKSGDGALDAGIYADSIVTYNGMPTWNPFINYKGDQGSTKIENGLAGYTYRLVNNQSNPPAKIKMWVSPKDKFVRMSITAQFLEFNQVTRVLNPKNSRPFLATKIYLYPKATLWSNSGALAAYKIMTSIAINKGENENRFKYTVDNLSDKPDVEGFKYSEINIGKGDEKGSASNLVRWVSLVAPSTKAVNNPCLPPEDMVVPDSTNHTAKISLRVKSKYDVAPRQISSVTKKINQPIQSSVVIKNIGPAGSYLYYDFKPLKSTRQAAKLASGETITATASDVCPASPTAFSQKLDVYYSENETLTADSSVLPIGVIPPAGLRTYKEAAGNLLFKKATYTFLFICAAPQSFQIPPTTLTALVNQSTPETTQNLTVISDSATVSGQYLVGPKAALAAQSIIVNADPVTPITPTPFQTKDLLVKVKPIKCGPTPETNPPLNYTISDPTGNTDPTDYAVTVRCVGPAISDPAPNPLNLSGTVGNPVTGTFTFQNVGEVVNGAQAPLTFSLSPSAGLTATVQPNTSPLAGGGTATVTVSGMCTSTTPTTYFVKIKSDDAARPEVEEKVVVSCTEPPPPPCPEDTVRQADGSCVTPPLYPKLTNLSPNPLTLRVTLGSVVQGIFSFNNSVANTFLTFSVSEAV